MATQKTGKLLYFVSYHLNMSRILGFEGIVTSGTENITTAALEARLAESGLSSLLFTSI